MERTQSKPENGDQEEEKKGNNDERVAPASNSISMNTKERKTDENNGESSSTGSSSGNRASGGGYSADYSSSDTMSDNSASRRRNKALHTEVPVGQLSLADKAVGEGKTEGGEIEHGQRSDGPKNETGKLRSDSGSDQHSKPNKDGSDRDTLAYIDDFLRRYGQARNDSAMLETQPTVPQWNLSSRPQWSGVRISHPMDPRIDLSTVDVVMNSSVPLMSANQHPSEAPPAPALEAKPPPNDLPGLRLENYANLMEVVRPFFNAHGLLQLEDPGPTNDQGASDDQQDVASPEGFTSFFTTTASSSDSDKKPAAVPNPPTLQLNPQRLGQEDPSRGGDLSDASSMVVLARVKRKHRKRQQQEVADTQKKSTANGGQQEWLQADHEGPRENENAQPLEDEIAYNAESEAQDDGTPQESTSSSSEERNNIGEADEEAPMHQFNAPAPRVVSESASNTNTGSGSGGNTGSGSNPGSSGSGNGSSGSGNEGKGSSEDVAQGENGTEDAKSNSDEINENSDEINEKEASRPAVESPQNVGAHRHGTIAADEPQSFDQPSTSHSHENEHLAAREKKLQDKKRKRMNMRREYEEKVEQQLASSESSQSQTEKGLPPGKPVTLEQVLFFSQIARIVVQAGPPFLVVHTNAAYSRLSGIDSHAAVGKNISALLLMPDAGTLSSHATRQGGGDSVASTGGNVGPQAQNAQNAAQQQDTDMVGEPADHNHAAAEAAGRGRAQAVNDEAGDMCLERLVAASGFGRSHVLHVLTNPHHLVGRNVTFCRGPASPLINNREEGSYDASIASADGSHRCIACRVTISPVVASPEPVEASVVTDKDQEAHHHKNKRRKHHHHNDPKLSAQQNHQNRRSILLKEAMQYRKNIQRRRVTHYVIQLIPLSSDPRKWGSGDSMSTASTSTNAIRLGLTKNDLRRQRMRLAETQPAAEPQVNDRMEAQDMPQENEAMASESESSTPKDPVSAIG